MSILTLSHIDYEIIGRMVRTAKILDGAISRKLSSYEITKAQFDILFVINFSGLSYLNASEIAKELFVSKANISKVIRHLIKKKYVVTIPDVLDLRIQKISLTKKAKNLLSSVLPEFFLIGNNALSSFSKVEKTKLLSQLHHIELQINTNSAEVKE